MWGAFDHIHMLICPWEILNIIITIIIIIVVIIIFVIICHHYHRRHHHRRHQYYRFYHNFFWGNVEKTILLLLTRIRSYAIPITASFVFCDGGSGKLHWQNTKCSLNEESNERPSDYQFGCDLRWWFGETWQKSECSEQGVKSTTFWLLVRMLSHRWWRRRHKH